MIAVPLVIAATVSAAAILIASAFLGGWRLREVTSSSRCACSHPYSFVDKFTGNCTGTMTEIHYTAGVRPDRKTVPCKCKAHRQPGLSVAEPLDREFVTEGSGA